MVYLGYVIYFGLFSFSTWYIVKFFLEVRHDYLEYKENVALLKKIKYKGKIPKSFRSTKRLIEALKDKGEIND